MASSSVSTPSTPAKSTGGSSTSQSSKSAIAVRNQLATNQIYIDQGVLDSGPIDIKELAERMKDIDRPSPGLSETDKIRITIRSASMKDRHEANAIDALLGLMFPEPGWIDQDTFPHLDRNRDREFLKDCVPIPNGSQNPNLQAALEVVGALKTPKPDLAFGYRASAFSPTQTLTNTTYDRISRLSPGILHPFIVLEWKSTATGGTQFDAQNQAARTAAAIIYSQRTLHGVANTSDTGSAVNSACFSCTIDSATVYLWIHWCQDTGEPPATCYHMELLFQLFLSDREAVWRLRRMINNIFEWGMGERLRWVMGVLDRIAASPVATTAGARKRKR
ncbi:MAG: hypothetical protein M1840_002173 [Geoglossum simile]|nr:MAG: hypothetical protein M1840_002173 [Geoglossum simile]